MYLRKVISKKHWLRPTSQGFATSVFAKNYFYVGHQLTIIIQFLWKKVYVEEIFYL
jgi:hypothetical protein